MGLAGTLDPQHRAERDRGEGCGARAFGPGAVAAQQGESTGRRPHRQQLRDRERRGQGRGEPGGRRPEDERQRAVEAGRFRQRGLRNGRRLDPARPGAGRVKGSTEGFSSSSA